jgi:DNA polymerase
MDFEAYSEAGYYWNVDLGRWVSVAGVGKEGGIKVVGAVAYAEHPTTEVLSLAYDLKDGVGPRLWLPGCPAPEDLFAHIAAGGLIEAWNSGFEYVIWERICRQRMGWPPLPLGQLRDAMAKSRAHGYPGKLEEAGPAAGVDVHKDSAGTRLLNKFSRPRKPTKANPSRRLRPEDDPDDAALLYQYNLTDIKAEAAISAVCPDLSPDELNLWLLDQRINQRGVYIDREGLEACIWTVDAATERYTAELQAITGGTVGTVGELDKMQGWLGGQGVHMPNMQADTVERMLAQTTGAPHRVLEIRSILGAAAVKKLFAISRRLGRDGRLRELFAYYGAHTGRWAGRGPQPQNLPSDTHEDPDAVLRVLAGRNLDTTVSALGDPIAAVSGCLRGLFCAAPGCELICSDYSAIEAVVAACLAGEQWRIDVFRQLMADPNAPDIYETSAAKITGVPVEEIAAPRISGEGSHKLRKGVGKVAELASGYQGWVGAWKAFGAEKHLADDRAIRDAVKKWRAESPNIVEMWGGQLRQVGYKQFRRELYGLEGAAISAILDPGTCYSYRSISYGVRDDVLYCLLPSGRSLAYHEPRLHMGRDNFSGEQIYKITFMGYNSDYKKGPRGWMRLDTYGGRLFENVVQAVARDLLTYAMPGLEAAGYAIVLHVHDEICAEVPAGYGSIEEFERIMGTLPPWAAGWPLRAAGGWRGKRYRKD